jgi:glyoxylase-like metal-dependent hydrolase (beta-lactamase superfamily II)
MGHAQDIQEIFKDFFFIQRGYLNANHFAYLGESPVLIDTGYLDDLQQTKSYYASLGLDPARVSLILNTHCHCDHIGGNRAIQEISGCQIALHHIGKYFIDNKNDWATWWKYYHQNAEFFQTSRGLVDGDEIYIGPLRFEVIHTPGHSADCIVFYNREYKTLLSSDALWENDIPAITERVEGSSTLFWLLQSLKRLHALEVEMVYPGHGRPFTDFKAALEKSMDKVQRYLEDKEKLGNDQLKKILVYTLLMRKGLNQDQLFEELMHSYWFPETINFYFNEKHAEKYQQIIQELVHKNVIQRKDGILYPAVKP